MEETINGSSFRGPNLFRYATSELSQDAFICWLLQWAAPEFKSIDPKLYECGTKFIDALFLRAGKSKPEKFDSIKVNKQVDSIDVLVVLKEASGDIHAIIIEDKTDTKHHSNQLERYYKIVKDKFKISESHIIPIYLKTGDQSSYTDINKSGYFEFLRKDFLCILREGKASGVVNDIFNDFLSHLEKAEHAVNKFRNEHISIWAKNNDRAWSGFFTDLKKELKTGNWEYVPNQSNGFMCFWWAIKKVGNVTLHLQLAENKLCFKIKVTEGKPSALRDEWQKRICKVAKELHPSLDITKPDRFGSGKHMTVAVLKSGYMMPNVDGILCLPSTINVMKKCEEIFEAATNCYAEPPLH